LELLHEIGYSQVEVVRDYQIFGMPRFTVAARR